ncbi:hypothetical protein C2845_PM13G05590 [Panicum miliaceum]|uniref:Terpene cyclase/mutase family member n=1 Tax=Panicum miliaceum TaxID=4540 RepID=A0A3L6RI44_PANMI|nr:hypothetical protein C2845_PM13G05590 [Panicum miliaceum]
MWKLKIADGGPWIKSGNSNIGRETWEFDQNFGSSEEKEAVDSAREEFQKNRFRMRHSSDILARMQLAKENNFSFDLQKAKDETLADINPNTVSEKLRKALSYFSAIQAHDGHWPGDFPGPLFTTATMIIVLYVTESLGVTLSFEHRKEICRYLYNRQNIDGGWGLHAEGESSMLSTALNYTALRLLGESVDDGPDMSMPKARKWVHDHGGATMIPILGKVWLSVLGVFEWSGVNPIPPELFLLPSLVPIQPGRLWSHFRMAFIPMSYLYGKKFVGPITRLVLSLREELHIHPYKKIDWKQARKLCAKEDVYNPHTWLQECLSDCLYSFGEPFLTRVSYMRKKALQQIAEFLKYEDENSQYICIGAAQKALSMLCCWIENPSSDAFKRHLARVADFLWVGEDGMKVRVCAGQLWDVAFAVQAILACNIAEEYKNTLKKAHDFIKASQIMDNPSGDFSRKYRHISKGGWAFQVADQGWQVSDCTAEALKALLLLSTFSPDIAGDPMETCRLHDAVNNPNGGYGTWELARTYPWMEIFNMTEIYADIMVEHQYVECTSSVIQALVLFREKCPGHRKDEIDQCIRRATEFIEKLQNDDGSWFGSWGICFTYGTWFAIEGLSAVGQSYRNSTCIQKACKFLLSKQLCNGGWGESHLSSRTKIATSIRTPIINIKCNYQAYLEKMKQPMQKVERDPTPLHKAARLIMSMQLGNGDFPQEEMIGSFLKNGPLCYMAYRNIFPIWALGEYQKLVLQCELQRPTF